jgi:hypothetical protein
LQAQGARAPTDTPCYLPTNTDEGELLTLRDQTTVQQNTGKPAPLGAGFAERYSERSAEVRRGYTLQLSLDHSIPAQRHQNVALRPQVSNIQTERCSLRL